MLTRNYLPMLGRFTSRDVLAGDPNDPPSLNQFVYATGSPVTFSDPTGMAICSKCDGGSGYGDGEKPPPDDPDDEEAFQEIRDEYDATYEIVTILHILEELRPAVP